MSDQNQNKEDNFLRTLLISIICIPLIIWLLYNGYQKSLQSSTKSIACEKRCTDQGHAGYEFKWPMFSGPKCTCIDMK